MKNSWMAGKPKFLAALLIPYAMVLMHSNAEHLQVKRAAMTQQPNIAASQ
jgi:hypothetical protein